MVFFLSEYSRILDYRSYHFMLLVEFFAFVLAISPSQFTPTSQFYSTVFLTNVLFLKKFYLHSRHVVHLSTCFLYLYNIFIFLLAARDFLDPTVNKSVLCPHNMLGLRPLGRVVQVTQQCWNAIAGSFPLAIHLPYHRAGDYSSSSNSSEDCPDDPGADWICPHCQNEKQEGADESNNQKASRTLELSDPHLLTLYNSTRGRNKKKSRCVHKAQKKVVDAVEENSEEMVIDVDGEEIQLCGDIDNRLALHTAPHPHGRPEVNW